MGLLYEKCQLQAICHVVKQTPLTCHVNNLVL